MKNLFAFIFIVIVGLITVNSTIYTHSHRLANGDVITHAHPFKKSADSTPFENHKHTALELYFIQNLQLLAVVFIISFLFTSKIEREPVCCFVEELNTSCCFSSRFGRSPPFSKVVN